MRSASNYPVIVSQMAIRWTNYHWCDEAFVKVTQFKATLITKYTSFNSAASCRA